MLMNNLTNPAEIFEAWDDMIGDIGMLLENTECLLNGESLSKKERIQLMELQEMLEEMQECY